MAIDTSHLREEFTYIEEINWSAFTVSLNVNFVFHTEPISCDLQFSIQINLVLIIDDSSSLGSSPIALILFVDRLSYIMISQSLMQLLHFWVIA